MHLAGRTNELMAIAAAIAEAPTRSRVVLLDAEAGAGKSAVLQAAVAAAREDGLRVLMCHPTATESQLAYAALGDLLESVQDLGAVDPVPRAALERALLRGEPAAGAAEFDPRLVGVGCAAVWRELAAVGPLVIAIDDLHWLDEPSAEALAFSFRRLPAVGVTVVVARRSGEPSIALEAESIQLAPLDPDSLTTILVERGRSARRRLTARQLRAVVDASGGNPLFAIELARAAEQKPPTDGGVSVPRSLDDLIERRFGSVGTELHEALAAAALMARPDLAAIRRLGMLAAIEQAERDGLVDTSSGRITFSHPLFAAAILDRTPPSTRRAVHRRLAAVTDGAESIRHAALSAEGIDGDLADRLAALADDLVSRGAFAQAADFAVLAATLCPTDDPRRPDRAASAAQLSFQRGETETAMRMLDEIDPDTSPPAVRVRELMVRARIAFSTISSRASSAAAFEALRYCTTDAERIEVHSTLSRVYYDHFPTAAEHALLALDLAERTDVSPAILVSVLTAVAGTTFMSGGGLDREMWQRAMDIEAQLPMYLGESAVASFAVLLKVADELDEARTMLVQILADNADEGAVPYALSHLPQIELWTGNWDLAEDYASRHLEAALRSGQHDQVAQANSNLAQISLFRGDVDEARALAQDLLDRGRSAGDAWTERTGVGQLGLIALTEGDAESAVTLLERWRALGEEIGLYDPGYSRLNPDHVEALVATGRIDAAAERAAAMQADADRFGRPTLHASARRVSALVAAARGEREVAVALATDAVERSARTPFVVDHARALLTLGQIHRRFKEKSAARAALQAALEVFERLGATRFAERARQDLSRIGLRPPASNGLTETERRVAELAGVGRTVRQIGDELFITPKTVEANLTRVYRKLGLSGRAELAAWLLEDSHAACPIDDRDLARGSPDSSGVLDHQDRRGDHTGP